MSEGEGDTRISFNTGGVEWQCNAALRPALSLLNHIEPCTLKEMRAHLATGGKPLLRPFVMGLLLGNVIWAEPDDVDVGAPHEDRLTRQVSVGAA